MRKLKNILTLLSRRQYLIFIDESKIKQVTFRTEKIYMIDLNEKIKLSFEIRKNIVQIRMNTCGFKTDGIMNL